ncbi:histidine phosphatase family protein [Massilia psychrophila]|uniref:Phosphoglycerate mutase n=1 Tax=Massilia psychrophila TaxID=1603353 RepID=A0A2G8SWT1_9BURK|nr:histidine phosphatase family protein [Massilia psychrophila]PIL38224.1 phosphoglycerate mutase [Massilia psychrophila]GGE90816.1 phosphoglycerate mutase [Massilia psychrophila]
MQLYLVRHPQPLVGPGLCYGRTDLAVAPAETARVGAALSNALPAGAALFSSPLQRCLDLAEALGGAAAPTCDARLAELDFGNWEMQSWEHIARADIDAWAADVVHYRPGGGESVLHMAERVSAFYADLAALSLARAIVVCHAGTIRLLAECGRGATALQMAQRAAAQPHRIAYGGLLLLPGEKVDV